MTKRLSCIAAAVAMTVAAMPAHAEQWWVLYRSDTSTGVLDSCKVESPAVGFAAESLLGHYPYYADDGGDEVDVVHAGNNGRDYHFSYFRSSYACLAAARAEIDQAKKYK